MKHFQRCGDINETCEKNENLSCGAKDINCGEIDIWVVK